MLICYSVCFGNSFLTFVLSQICLNLTEHNFDWLILAISDLIVFLTKDVLSILTLLVNQELQTSPKNSSRTVGKCLGGYGLCKFPYLRMPPLYLIYGLKTLGSMIALVLILCNWLSFLKKFLCSFLIDYNFPSDDWELSF